MSYGAHNSTTYTPKGDYEPVPDPDTETLNNQYDDFDVTQTTDSGVGKVIEWAPYYVLFVFVAVVFPVGIYGCTIMNDKPNSDVYDFALGGNALLEASYRIVTSNDYSGLFNVYPVLVNVVAKDGRSMINRTNGHGVAFSGLCGKLQADQMMGKVTWLQQVSVMKGYFLDTYNEQSYVAGASDEQSVIKLGWKTPVVKQADLDNMKAYLAGTAFVQSGNYLYTISGPGLEEPGDISVAVLIAFPIIYAIMYCFAVAARTSPFAFLVPLFSVTISAIVSYGSLVWVGDTVKVTSFAIVLCLSTACSISGSSAIAIMQRAASNASYDESFGRPIRYRIFLAATDIKFFLSFPFVCGSLFMLLSSIKDEAVRSISRSVGAAFFVAFITNLFLLPSLVAAFYPILFREFAWWTKLMAALRLPRSMRRSTTEESETEHIMSAVRDVTSRNLEKQEDSVFSRAVAAARSRPWVSFGLSSAVYGLFTILLLSTSVHLLTNYQDVVAPQSIAVETLRTVSQTYGQAVAVPYFFIIQLSGPENKTEVSEDDFNFISQFTSDILTEVSLGSPSLDQVWSIASLRGNHVGYQEYLSATNTQNQSAAAVEYRHLLNSVLSADLMYASIKLHLPSKADTFQNSYGDFMKNVEMVAIQQGQNFPGHFVGAFGPSAGLWDAVNDVSSAYKLEAGLLVLFVVIAYLVMTRALAVSAFGLLWCVLHTLMGMCFGAMSQKLQGFYYVSPPIVTMFCVLFFVFNDVGSLEFQIGLREQKRFSNDRIIIETLNLSEAFRWHTLIVSFTFFMLVFSLVDVVATVGISVALTLLAETFVFRVFVYPAFLSLVERSGNVKRFFFFRNVAENVGELLGDSDTSSHEASF